MRREESALYCRESRGCRAEGGLGTRFQRSMERGDDVKFKAIWGSPRRRPRVRNYRLSRGRGGAWDASGRGADAGRQPCSWPGTGHTLPWAPSPAPKLLGARTPDGPGSEGAASSREEIQKDEGREEETFQKGTGGRQESLPQAQGRAEDSARFHRLRGNSLQGRATQRTGHSRGRGKTEEKREE